MCGLILTKLACVFECDTVGGVVGCTADEGPHMHTFALKSRLKKKIHFRKSAEGHGHEVKLSPSPSHCLCLEAAGGRLPAQPAAAGGGGHAGWGLKMAM